MHIDEMFKSKYIKAVDLGGRSLTLKIHSVDRETMRDGTIKFVVYFADQHGGRRDRGFVLNKTNGKIIAEQHGPNTDNWIGKPITIAPARVEYAGELVDGIRVQLQARQGAQANTPLRQPEPPPHPGPSNGRGDGMDDEIPF